MIKLDFLYITRKNENTLIVSYRSQLRSNWFELDETSSFDLYDIIGKIYSLENGFYDKLYPKYLEDYDEYE